MSEDMPDALPEVAASEADLIELTRVLVAPDHGDAVPLLLGARPMAHHVSPACGELLAEALRMAWPAVWRRGAVIGARPWRGPPAELAFGPPTFALLRWLVATPLGAPLSTHGMLAPSGPLALGDQLIAYLALAAADGTPAQAAIMAQPVVRAAPLAWLGFAHVAHATLGAKEREAMTASQAAALPLIADLALALGKGDRIPLDAIAEREAPTSGGVPPHAAFDALATGAGVHVVSALAPELAKRWRAAELGKRGATDPARMIALGGAQDATLGAWLAACDRHHRRDLAAWVIDAAAPLLARELSPTPGRLDPNAPLAVRSAARIAAGALLRGVVRWGAWDHQHRGVRFIDDDYADVQHLLARFEAIGAAGVGRATQWLGDLAALPAS